MVTGVLLLHGSSGAPLFGRARLLRQEGVLANAVRWFGGPGQPPSPCRVPLESLSSHVDVLVSRCDRVVVMGTSFGAELGLLLAAYDPRVSAVAAFAPSAVVWGGVEDGVQCSHWTWRGDEVPYARFVPGWEPVDDPPSYLGLYEASWAQADSAAAIPTEQIKGEVLLVAGGDDHVWPSLRFAEEIRRRRGSLPTTILSHPQAGHRTVLPGEEPPRGGLSMSRGGTPAADAELGEVAWPHLLRLIHGEPNSEATLP